MVTACARAINEVWRDHLFQLSITFHGGMEAIAYEWGSPNHMSHGSESPDEVAQASMATAMAKYAGAFKVGTAPRCPCTASYCCFAARVAYASPPCPHPPMCCRATHIPTTG